MTRRCSDQHLEVRAHEHQCDVRKRRGFILPTVLIAMLLVAILAANLQSAVWRASRGSRLGFAGERALHGADAAIAQQLTLWNAREFASMAIGDRKTSTIALASGTTTTVSLARTALAAAIVEASTSSTKNGVSLTANRRVTRMLVARNLPLPLQNALTSLGPLALADPSNASNVDQVPVGWTTECANESLVNAPATPLADINAARTQFDASWNQWLALAARSDDGNSVTFFAPTVTSGSCDAGTGEPWRGAPAVAPCTNEWGARAFANANPMRITVSSRHQGVLLVDGDLILESNLEIDGLLIVRGAIDASAGRLTVNGAVLIRDTLGHGSRLGFASRVRYSRCALRRALSAVAAPAAITTGGWLERF